MNHTMLDKAVSILVVIVVFSIPTAILFPFLIPLGFHVAPWILSAFVVAGMIVSSEQEEKVKNLRQKLALGQR